MISLGSRTIALLLCLTDWTTAHGTVIGINGHISGSTGSRSWQTHKGLHRPLQEYDQYSLLGVGGRIDEFDSPGGEPGQTQHGVQYQNVARDANQKPWDVSISCRAGDVVSFRVAITANHGGINEFRYVCTDQMPQDGILRTLDFYDKAPALKTATACYASNPDSNIWRGGVCYQPRTLLRADTDDTLQNFHSERPEMYILAMPAAKQCWSAQKASSQGTGLDMTYKLPSSLANCKRVVVQWWWQTTNSCISPTWNKWRKAGTWPCSSTQWPSWNFPECDASKGTKAGSGEQFAALIDIPLGSSSCDASTGAPPPPSPPKRTLSPAPPTTSPPSRTPAPTPPTTAAPATGDCLGSPCENPTYCRSKYGYCGPGPLYCTSSIWSSGCKGSKGTTSSKTCKGQPCKNKTHCRSKWGFCGPSTLPGYCTTSSLWNPSGCDTTNLQQSKEDDWVE